MIQLLFTGGTISMRHDPAAGGNVPALDGKALLQAAGMTALEHVQMEDWERLPAVHRGPERVWALRNRIAELAGDPAIAGVVVPHGTDTLAETAYLIARTTATSKPIVLTGAMRTSSALDWDGPRNLADAVTVARESGERCAGTLVVFHGKVLGGMTAAKMHTGDPDAFAAPFGNPLGEVRDGSVRWVGAVSRPEPLTLPDGLTARVALIPLVLGDDGRLLDLARPHHDGVVVVGFGRGNVPPAAVPAIERWLAEGKPVVLSSRCPYGEVGPDYAFDGGGGQLLRRGVVAAGPRTSTQARLELLLALSARVPYGEGTAG